MIDDLPWLYWTAASWGGELSLAPSQLARITELASVRALLGRAKALEANWERGAIYEALIPFDGLPPPLGGSAAAARADFDKAMEFVGEKIRVRVCRAGDDDNRPGGKEAVTGAGADD
jgi:hypothetical protein